VEGYLSDTPTGILTPTPRPNWGYFSDSEGSWESGRLAWSHIQNSNQKSHYAIYFDVLAPGLGPHQSTPRGFLGDGGMRALEQGTTSTGVIEQRIDVSDWDGDGIVGPSDLQVWQLHHGDTVGTSATSQASGQPVPEPATAIMLASLCAMMLASRRHVGLSHRDRHCDYVA
jgi:hypothetical protein